MSAKLNGSFSGLWTCELCGKTGTDCTCEHFQRDGNVWGPDKTLTDAELSAEAYRQLVRAVAKVGLVSHVDDDDNVQVNERPDTESELAPGDDVQTLIDYRVHERGKKGFVDRVVDTDEYPVKVMFNNETYPVGYKRHELGKL